MSSELIKRISFKKDGVYFSASSSNVTPKHYYSEKSRYHTDLLNNEGKKSVIKCILWDFVTGCFKPKGDNTFVNQLANTAYRVKQTEQYETLNNIYWCWDDIERLPEEKKQAKKQIEDLLLTEWGNELATQ